MEFFVKIVSGLQLLTGFPESSCLFFLAVSEYVSKFKCRLEKPSPDPSEESIFSACNKDIRRMHAICLK